MLFQRWHLVFFCCFGSTHSGMELIHFFLVNTISSLSMDELGRDVPER